MLVGRASLLYHQESLLSAQDHTNTLTTERELSTTPSAQVHVS